LEEFATGRPVVLLDETWPGAGPASPDAHLVFAAELATPATLAFAIRHTSGFVCVALPAQECDRLRLPPMYPTYDHAVRGSYTVTVDAVSGISTGISARDRARTIRLLASAETVPADLARPGHVVPCSVSDAQAQQPGNPAQTALAIAHLAGLRPASAFSALVSDTARDQIGGGLEVRQFAIRHGLAMITTHEVNRHLASGDWRGRSGDSRLSG
jgi:3,4-dihydroxy 2-butanone 4-phosphate synthase/GTP cyclohydrolase II